jgi:hypothetical protein
MSDKIRIFNPIKNRFVKVNTYGITAKKLYKLYIDDLNTPAENVLPPGLKYNPETGYFTKTKEKKSIDKAYLNVKKLVYEDNFINTNQSTFSIVKNFMKQFRGKTIKVVSYRNGLVANQGIITIPDSYASWWKTSAFFGSYIQIDSEFDIFSPPMNWKSEDPFDDNPVLKDRKNQGILVVDTLNKIQPEKYLQSFLYGVSHCFFTTIKELAVNKK